MVKQQHGFTEDKKIETDLLKFTHYISETLDRDPRTQINVIYTDFQKAFDD